MKRSYETGIIYGFKCKKTNQLYIGSTIQPLKTRHSKHITDFRGWSGYKNNKPRNYRSSFEIIKNNDYDVFEIEKYSCENKRELEARETLYIINNKCVNKQIPCRNISIDSEIFETEKFKLPPSPLVVA
tara:strand:- start:1621 stop:2007 length:387 start_codon:yes stop_codon:yes gene_type:complete